VLPEGTHAAKLTDLQKNHELKLFDQTVYLSTGRKQGLLAFRIPDELWVVTYTDFANGTVKFKKDNTGVQYAETDAAKKIVNKLKDGFKISFVAKENGGEGGDIVLYSVDGSEDYNEAVKASVAVYGIKVSKAEVLQNKIYTCTDDGATKTFKFLDNTYTYEHLDGRIVVDRHEGHYDIQRSTLLMLPTDFSKSLESLYVYSVSSKDNTISSSEGETMNCTVKDVK
jgi:hypothetical protein